MGATESGEGKRTYSAIALLVACTWLLGLLFQLVWGMLNGSVFTIASTRYGVWLSLLVPLYLLAFPISLFLLHKLPSKAPERAHLPAWKCLGLFCVSILLIYAGAYMGELVTYALSGGRGEDVILGLVQTQDAPGLKFIATILVTPMMEELFFRKMLIDRVLVFGEKRAEVFSAVVFALFHMNIAQFFYAAFAGLVLAHLYIHTGRLLAPFLLHAMLNLFGGFLPSFFSAGAGKMPAIMSELFYAGMLACCVLGVFFLLLAGRKALRKNCRRERISPAVYNPGIVFLFSLFCGITALTYVL